MNENSSDVMLLCGLWDRIDGQYMDALELYPNANSARIAIAKTLAYSSAVKEEFEFRVVGHFNIHTGEITPCPSTILEMDEDVYERCISVLKARESKFLDKDE